MLMEHNKEAYEQFKAMLLEHRECLLIAATGIGKSNITTEFIKEMNLNVLVVAPLEGIRKNWSDMPEKYGIPTEINAITYQYFYRHWKDLYGFDAYIFDEAHHSGSKVWGKAIESFRIGLSDEFIIGLTADPNRYSDKENRSIVESVYHNHVVYGLDQREAVNKGILPKADYICALYNMNDIFQKYKDIPMTDELYGRLCYTMKNCDSIEDILRRHTPKNVPTKGIIFVDSINNIDMGIMLANRAFPKEAIYHIHSGLSVSLNDKTLELFKSSKSGFIVTVDMLNEGLHIENVNVIIMLRKTQSPSIYTQQIGRGLAPNNQNVTIYDLVRNDTSIKKVLARIDEFESLIDSTDEDDEFDGGERNIRISNQSIVKDYATDILSILDEINRYAGNSKRWTKKEDQILKDYYLTDKKRMLELLPNRSLSACINRASMLKLTNPDKPWTEEEDQIIRDNYSTIGKDVYKLLPDRSQSSCMQRARTLGVKSGVIKWWTEEEDKILIDNYPTIGGEAFKLLPNRSKGSCQQRVIRLGLKHEATDEWTEEEHQIIRKYYPSLGRDVARMLPGRTEDTCVARATLLGVKRNDFKPNWSEEEDKILIDNYPIIGPEVSELLPNRTKGACYARARILNLIKKAGSEWTEEEDKILRDYYPTMGSDVCTKIPCRTRRACSSRAKLLKIGHQDRKPYWTESEDRIIIEYYPTLGGKIIDMLPGRTKLAIRNRAKKLGVAFYNRK